VLAQVSPAPAWLQFGVASLLAFVILWVLRYVYRRDKADREERAATREWLGNHMSDMAKAVRDGYRGNAKVAEQLARLSEDHQRSIQAIVNKCPGPKG